jgi:hypothetical protein
MSELLELTVCPECGAAAEVIDRFVLPSTHGPIAHAKVRCVTGPWFVVTDTPGGSSSSDRRSGRGGAQERPPLGVRG